MKKVILCAAALVFGTVAFAQVDGAPEADTPVANMSADSDANRGKSIQEGNLNKVRVRQAGTKNRVFTDQEDGNGMGGNLGYIIQTGDVGPNSGRRNAAELHQSGTANESTTIQQGNRNNAITLQGQNDGEGSASANNQARIQQGNNGQAEENFAAIEQDGTSNIANTLQRWDNNDAWTRQTGNGNKSMIDQAAPPEDSEGHEAANFQLGDRNESSIAQRGEGARNVAVADQIGDDNQAKQDQTATSGVEGMGNDALVRQGFPTELTADVPLSEQSIADMDAAFDEFVNDGINTTSAESFGAKAKQVQNGKLQDAEIIQYGGSVGASNVAEQYQTSGWNNDASIIQGHFDLGEPDNYARQDQAGDNNRAGILQEGSGNKALQTQVGHRNDALNYQTGEGNLSNTHQRGNDNVGYAYQDGDGNRALLVQYGGQSYMSTQDGTMNQVDALQLGPNGNFDSQAIDCDFDEEMDLDMDYSIPGLEIEMICPDC